MLSIDKIYLATKLNLPDPMYQRKSTEPDFLSVTLIQIYQTKPIEPNLPNQNYKTESTKSNLASKIFEMQRTK